MTGSFTGLGNTIGSIKDLNTGIAPVGVTFLLPGFVNLAAAPNIRFNLTFINPGVYPSSQCSAPAAAGQKCTLGVFSPFNFSNTTATSSTLNFSVQGNFVNTATGEVTPGSGLFTMQFPSVPYQNILADLIERGFVDTTYNAELTAMKPGKIQQSWWRYEWSLVCIGEQITKDAYGHNGVALRLDVVSDLHG